MTVAVDCYVATKPFPREEQFGLTTQIRRAATSIPADIAEGFGRETTATFIHFLHIAQGSQKELETHVLLAERVGLLTSEAAAPLLRDVESISRMLRNLIRSLLARQSAAD